MAVNNIEKLKAMRIGCDNVVWCRLTEDSDGKTSPTYAATVYALPGVMSLNINPNTSIETAFYDDGPGDVATTLGNIEVSFSKSALGPKEKAILLGKSLIKVKTDSSGTENKKIPILVHSSNDTPPWGALGFRSLKSDGTYKYSWLLKGKFMDPVDNNETKTDSINFQNDEITGRFVKLNVSYKVIDKSEGGTDTRDVYPWKMEMDETDIPDSVSESDKAKILAKWFEKVVTPFDDLVPTTLELDESMVINLDDVEEEK